MGLRTRARLLILIGAALTVAGVGYLFPPAGVILAGLLCTGAGVLLATRLA
jgi:hypothetical protein